MNRAWLSTETEGLIAASKDCKPIVMDFFAEWCEACHDLDKFTFTDDRIKELVSKEFIPIKIDATKPTPDVQKILMKYGVLGLPTILFLDSKGNVITDLSLSGFLHADEFLELLKKADARQMSC